MEKEQYNISLKNKYKKKILQKLLLKNFFVKKLEYKKMIKECINISCFNYIQYRKKQSKQMVTCAVIFTKPNYSNLNKFKN